MNTGKLSAPARSAFARHAHPAGSLCAIVLAVIVVVHPPTLAQPPAGAGWSFQNASTHGGLSDDELNDVSMYDIDRELYGDEAVGVGRTYSDDDRFVRPEPQPTPGARIDRKDGLVVRSGTTKRAATLGQQASRLSTVAQGEPIAALLGGTDDDVINGVAVATDGSIWVVGTTYSPDFPLVKPLQPRPGGGGTDVDDAFVARLSPDLGHILFSTYLGGSEFEVGAAIALTADGSPVVVGHTGSSDFPTRGGPGLAGACAARPTACPDVFVTQLSPDGQQFSWSAAFGGKAQDAALDVGLDETGRVYVTGHTVSPDFPVLGALQARYAAGSCGGSARRDCEDAFVTVVHADGGQLAWSTYLGGKGDDRGRSLAVDAAGNVVVTGRTTSTDFPTANAFQPRSGGGTCMGALGPEPCADAFVASIDRDGTRLGLGSYLGGRADDGGFGVAVDGSGRVAVIGSTSSPDFPLRDPLQPKLAGGASDAFFTALGASNTIEFSTFLGSTGIDAGRGVAASGRADETAGGFVVAGVAGRGFPSFQPLPNYAGGESDGFVGRFVPNAGAPTAPAAVTPPIHGTASATPRPDTTAAPAATAGPMTVRGRVYLPICRSK